MRRRSVRKHAATVDRHGHVRTDPHPSGRPAGGRVTGPLAGGNLSVRRV
jgi:hypothetical protein